MKRITDVEFLKMLDENDSFESLEVDGDIHRIVGGPQKVFSNCKFKTLTLFTKLNIVSFINCTFQNLQIKIEAAISEIKLENCDVRLLSIEGNNSVVVNKAITIQGSDTTIGKFDLKGGFFCSEISIEEAKNIKRCNLEVNCTNLDFSKILSIDYLIVSGEVKNQFTIDKCKNLKFFLVRDLTGERFECSDSSSLDIEFATVNFKYINFNRSVDVSLEISYLTADNMGLSEGIFKKIQLFHDNNFNLTTSFKVEIKTLDFSSTRIPKDKNFNFEEVLFNKIILDGIQNDGLVHILNCEIVKTLTALRSNLGRFQFTNVRIDQSCRIDILDCNINDVLFNSFKWNKNYKLSEDFDSDIQVRYKTDQFFFYSLRESYRQLKSNYLKSGNKIESLEFQKREMNIHYLILESEKFKGWRNFGNFLIVGTNKWFSDFGQNIWKPFFGLFLAHLILFNLLIVFFDFGFTLPTSFETIDIDATSKAINLFFHTLLPTHFTTVRDLNNNDVSIAGFLDFLMRIFSGYFLYYFINASRKYHQ